MTIGDRLKTVRLRAKLTQTEFGKEVGLEQRTLSNYERGVDQPGKGRLYLIAEKFGVNPEWLINGTGEPYKSSEVSADDRAEIEREYILRLFSELSPKTRRVILDVLKDWVEQDKLNRPFRNNIEINGTINGGVSINNEGEK